MAANPHAPVCHPEEISHSESEYSLHLERYMKENMFPEPPEAQSHHLSGSQ